MKNFCGLVFIFFMVVFNFTSSFAEDAYSRVKAETTSISLSLDSDANGIGNIFSPRVQYFIANNFFVEGGLRYGQGAVSNGISYNTESYGVLVGLGGAVPLNNSVILSLGADYSNYFYDLAYEGSSLPGSVNANGFGIAANLEFFVNSKTSLGLGVVYQYQTGTYRDTGTTFDSHDTLLSTGWKFYFN